MANPKWTIRFYFGDKLIGQHHTLSGTTDDAIRHGQHQVDRNTQVITQNAGTVTVTYLGKSTHFTVEAYREPVRTDAGEEARRARAEEADVSSDTYLEG